MSEKIKNCSTCTHFVKEMDSEHFGLCELGGTDKGVSDNFSCFSYKGKCINSQNSANKEPMEDNQKPYEYVNHPQHYNTFLRESIDTIELIYGAEWTYIAAEITAHLYQDRMGTKPDNSTEQECKKRDWWLAKREEMKAKLSAEQLEYLHSLLPKV